MDIYLKKYLKYKSKYIELRDKMSGGGQIRAIFFFENKNLEHNTLIKGFQVNDFVQYSAMETLGPISKLYIPGNKFFIVDSNKKVTKVTLPITKVNNYDIINTQIRRQTLLNNYRYLILQYDKPATPFDQILNMEILFIDPLLKTYILSK